MSQLPCLPLICNHSFYNREHWFIKDSTAMQGNLVTWNKLNWKKVSEWLALLRDSHSWLLPLTTSDTHQHSGLTNLKMKKLALITHFRKNRSSRHRNCRAGTSVEQQICFTGLCWNWGCWTRNYIRLWWPECSFITDPRNIPVPIVRYRWDLPDFKAYANRAPNSSLLSADKALMYCVDSIQ